MVINDPASRPPRPRATSTTNPRPAPTTLSPEAAPSATTARRGAGGSRQSVVNSIAEDIRLRVARGDLRPGDRLPSERDLAQHFGVSSPTVREAMRVLATMGVVEVRHGSGTYVTASAQDMVDRSLQTLVQIEGVTLEQILEVRMALREQLARAAAVHATDAELDALEVAQVAYEAASTTERVPAALEMLSILSGLAHNPLLQALDHYLNNLVIEFQRVVFANQSDEFWHEWGRSFQGHRRALIDALRRRDADAAVDAMREYHASAAARLTGDETISSARLADATLRIGGPPAP
ncbi:MAG: FadR/GntR family transcriptional regulator [Desertimonas sp.]